MWEIAAKGFKSCPKSNNSPNVVTLIINKLTFTYQVNASNAHFVSRVSNYHQTTCPPRTRCPTVQRSLTTTTKTTECFRTGSGNESFRSRREAWPSLDPTRARSPTGAASSPSASSPCSVVPRRIVLQRKHRRRLEMIPDLRPG